MVPYADMIQREGKKANSGQVDFNSKEKKHEVDLEKLEKVIDLYCMKAFFMLLNCVRA